MNIILNFLIAIYFITSNLHANENNSMKIVDLFAFDKNMSSSQYIKKIDKFIQWEKNDLDNEKKYGKITLNNEYWVLIFSDLANKKFKLTLFDEVKKVSDRELQKLNIDAKYIMKKEICIESPLLREIRYIIKLENKNKFLLIENYSSGASSSAYHSYVYELLFNYDNFDCNLIGNNF